MRRMHGKQHPAALIWRGSNCRYSCLGYKPDQKSYSRTPAVGKGGRASTLHKLHQQEKGKEMKTFLKRNALLCFVFFAIGQWLFGCSGKEELLAYRTVGKATIEAQGELDKKWLELAYQNREQEGKITVYPAPLQPPTITTITDIENGPIYIEELGDRPAVEKKTITTTQTDNTAYAIQQLGAVALALAERTGGYTRGGTGRTNTIPRIVYQMPEMPKNGAADIIRATGDALKVSGAIPAIVQGWLGWMAADTVQEVSRVPSHQGDYIRTDQSFNPTSTTTLPGEK